MTNDGKKKEVDLFIADTVYPDAESVFTAKYKSLDDIKGEAIIVLDANALLVPYTLSAESFAQIEKTLRALVNDSRLVIPGQVAREFAKHRASKIGETYHQLFKKLSGTQAVDLGNYPLLDSFDTYKEALAIQKEINARIIDYRHKLKALIESIQNWTWDDPVSQLYSEIFRGNVIQDITKDSSKKEKILDDHSVRSVHKIPPGYKDASKLDEGIGDLIIWHTILEIAAQSQKSVVFVSGEMKPDWWHRSNEQPLYPRYELIDEFRRSSNGQTFHIIRFSRLLSIYGVTEAVVDEVREKEDVAPMSITSDLTTTALDEWVSSNRQYRLVNYDPDSRQGDVVSISSQAKIRLKVVKTFGDLYKFLGEISTGAVQQLTKHHPDYDYYLYIVILKDATLRRIIEQRVRNHVTPEMTVSVYIGFVTDEGQLYTPQVVNPILA